MRVVLVMLEVIHRSRGIAVVLQIAGTTTVVVVVALLTAAGGLIATVLPDMRAAATATILGPVRVNLEAAVVEVKQIGTANTGGGGGGGSSIPAGYGKAGGSGIIIIRYEVA